MKAAEELKKRENFKQVEEKENNFVSLNNLKKEKEGKNPTKENISNLKQALSSIIIKNDNKVPEKKVSSLHKEVVSEKPADQKVKEVPEEVLKKLLSMEEK